MCADAHMYTHMTKLAQLVNDEWGYHLQLEGKLFPLNPYISN